MLEKTKMAVCSAMLLVSLLFVASPIAMGLVETKSGQQQIKNSDDYDGGIITGKNTKGYERWIITIRYNDEYSSTGVSHDEILLSCCLKSKKDKSCDFADDTIECSKYIDRETGKAYKHKTVYL